MTTERIIANRYTLLDPIGHGASGEVFRGRDLHTGGFVALKRLRPDVAAFDPDQRERFRREAEALRKLSHPGIVTLLDDRVEGDEHFLVLEYVPGGSLASLLRQEIQLPLPSVLDIALPLADALASVHRLKIIHRDIKPSNVLVAEDGSPRLTDFGIARMDGRTRLTQAGAMIGTLAYLSPEGCNGEDLDYRADIWSFGVLLYQMLVGTTPWGTTRPVELVTAIVHGPVPNPAPGRPDAPPALVRLIRQMLAKDRELRTPSMRLAAVELERIQRGL